MKETTDRNYLLEVARRFDVGGDISSVVRHTTGHINHTYIVTAESEHGLKRFILQRVNTDVFTEPSALMDNIIRVTETVARKVEDRGGNPAREALTPIRTTDGNHSMECDRGDFWRSYRYVEGRTHDVIPEGRLGVTLAREAAGAFGRFQRDIASLDPADFHEPIPDFHNTPVRYRAFEEAVGRDTCGRAGGVWDEIAFCRGHRNLCELITGPLDRGEIPRRLVHNDTKINNIIFHNGTTGAKSAACVIDLDTVMAGSALFDFGDQVRSTISYAEEDERDVDKVTLEPMLFEALANGYLSEAGEFLTDREKELLPAAGLVITFETGLRFLTDHLQGDCYFQIGRTAHNLDRARTQFRLVALMEEKMAALEDIVRRYV